jgi:flagellar basal body-associated protein FliL
MDLRNKKRTKIIRMGFIIIITIILVELVIAGVLFITGQKKQKNTNTADKEPIKLITEIEKEAILQKEPLKIKKSEEIKELDTDPRTRPLPQSNIEPLLLNITNTNEINSVEDPRTRPLP